MWKKFVNDYFRFTRKDRVGILVLVSLICTVVLLPVIWPAKKIAKPSRQEIEKITRLAARLRGTDSTGEPEERAATTHYTAAKEYHSANAETFYFDPNTLDAAGWKRLGIHEKTAATIRHYVEKGGKFRRPEDIGKIYGLFKDDYRRLLPYVQIKSEDADGQNGTGGKRLYMRSDFKEKEAAVIQHATPKIIDINTADTSAFIALPGIGAKLAARIVNFRSKLGGFYAVQQVAETYGLPDSTYTGIQHLLQCNAPAVQQLNINTADANTLKQHPYIRWALANAIVQYRNQHGGFKSVEDLQQIALVTPGILAKIKPYLVVQ